MLKKFSLFAPLLLIAACGVSTEKYTALEDQLRNETAARTACEKGLTSLSSTKTELEQKTKTYEDLMSSLKKEVDAGKVKISEMEGRLTVNLIDKILFDSGHTDVKPEGKEALSKIADVLKNVEDKRIQVEGHTDDVKLGPTLQKRFPSNWELSTARATAVVKVLAETGVPETKLSATGFSMFSPVAPNDTEDGRRQNRRIEIVLLPKLAVQPAAQ